MLETQSSRKPADDIRNQKRCPQHACKHLCSVFAVGLTGACQLSHVLGVVTLRIGCIMHFSTEDPIVPIDPIDPCR